LPASDENYRKSKEPLKYRKTKWRARRNGTLLDPGVDLALSLASTLKIPSSKVALVEPKRALSNSDIGSDIADCSLAFLESAALVVALIATSKSTCTVLTDFSYTASRIAALFARTALRSKNEIWRAALRAAKVHTWSGAAVAQSPRDARIVIYRPFAPHAIVNTGGKREINGQEIYLLDRSALSALTAKDIRNEGDLSRGVELGGGRT